MEAKKRHSLKGNNIKTIQSVRKIHRFSTLVLFLFLLIIGISGTILGWKKNSGEFIMPHTYEGTSTDLSEWVSLDSIYKVAARAIADSVSPDLPADLDRIDVRKEKGVAKVVFISHHWEVQVDGATGVILHTGKRRSDLLEDIHDGSIIDNIIGTPNGEFKLAYTSLMGIALITFTITGLWLYLSNGNRRNLKKKRIRSKQ
jgi:uncharacterized iron-regulated membrane protein